MLTISNCDICEHKDFCKYRLDTMSFSEKITNKEEDTVNSEPVPSHLDVKIRCKYYK